MKRLFIFVTITALATLLFGLLRAKEHALLGTSADLLGRQIEATHACAEAEAQQAVLRQNISTQKAQSLVVGQEAHLSPALIDWLLAGNFSEVPDSLVAELRSALDLPPNPSADFVLVSKASLRRLQPRSPGRNDVLSGSLCALLALSPEQRHEIETALSNSRREFSEWARQNLQRDGPQGDTLVRYTIPAANDPDDSITNRLMAKLSALIGPERTDLFCSFADTWFQIETGWLGSVTNTLSVLRRPGSDGQPALFYHLTREGPHSALGEGPGPIQPQFFPPVWRNVFPGGWPEIAQREGFELPPQKGE